MLTSLLLRNFKPFSASGRVRLAPITLVYGPNSSGKSSLIQSLLLLKQTLTPTGDPVLATRGREVDLGSYRSLIHRHELSNRLEISASFLPSRVFAEARRPVVILPRIRFPTTWGRHIALQYKWNGSDSDGFAALENAQYLLLRDDNSEAVSANLNFVPYGVGLFADSEMFEDGTFLISDEKSRNSISQFFMNSEQERRDRLAQRNPYSEEVSPIEFSFQAMNEIVSTGHIRELNGLPSRFVPPRSAPDAGRPIRPWHEVFSTMSSELQHILHSLSYLGPLRSHPARHYVTVSSPLPSVGSEGENTPQILHQKEFAVDQVNRWFKSFGIPYELNMDTIGNEVTGTIISIVLRDTRTQTAVAPSDVGFGIGQLLPILVEGIVSVGKVLCVEQPEIHLHPRLQAHLADFFIESTGLGAHYRRSSDPKPFPFDAADRWNQWIVETHSETLMLRLQRRIRQKVVRPQDVSVIYVDSGESGSVATELRLDENGGFIDEWPDGFFEEDVHEIFGEDN